MKISPQNARFCAYKEASEKLTAMSKVRKKKNIQTYVKEKNSESKGTREMYFELHICLNLKLMEE